MLEDITLHLGIATAVTVLIAKATKHLRCSVPLGVRKVGLVPTSRSS
jgi:hypothetical protein